MSSEPRPVSISVERLGGLRFQAQNERGGTFTFGSGDSEEFTPVELLLVALAGCGAVDVDLATRRRAEPSLFTVTADGNRVTDEGGNRVQDLSVRFRVEFPEGEDGDRARRILDRSIAHAHDKLCTVSRTVELGTPVVMERE